MNVITAPNHDVVSDHLVFMAGGITGAPDWQAEFISSMDEVGDVTFANPRRPDYKDGDEYEAKEQIAWEQHYLTLASTIVFWFPAEALCRITMFELGYWLGYKFIILGVHPDFDRHLDVVEQTRLVDPDLPIYDNLEAVITATHVRLIHCGC